jgi:PqqD family protein of HPr-rel-A system
MSNSINDDSGESVLLPRRRDLAHRMAGQEALVRDAEGGMVHFLSPTAAVIYECCDGATNFSACEARLRDSFDVPPGTDLAQDIREALADFAKKGLLE